MNSFVAVQMNVYFKGRRSLKFPKYPLIERDSNILTVLWLTLVAYLFKNTSIMEIGRALK